MKRLLLFTAACLLGLTSVNAQLVSVFNETMDNSSGAAALPPGAVTYRVWAEVADPTDFVTSVFAIDGCYNLEINANNSFYNTAFGGQTSANINPAFFGLAPEVEHDTYFDLGSLNALSGAGPIGAVASNPGTYFTDVTNTWQGGNDTFLDDGSWFRPNGDPFGFPVDWAGDGSVWAVFLFQVTVPDPAQFNYKINVQIIDDVNGSELYVHDETDDLICGSGLDDIDGSALGLIYPFVPGCTDMAALNFDAAATVDDGSCIVPACAAVPSSYCYGDGGDSFSVIADGADPIVLQITSSDVETCCDVFNIYDGTDNTGTLLAGPLTGDQTGLAVEATSGNLFVEFVSDGSFSCVGGQQGSFDFDLYCGSIPVPGCTDQDAVNYDGAATVDDGSCIIVSCDADDNVPPVAALNENYCYDTGVESFTYVADPGEQVTIVFTAGSMESCCDDLNIYDGQSNADPLILSTTGDISSVVATSTSGFITVEFDGDVSVDCASGAHAEAFWDVYCGTLSLDVPGCTTPGSCNFDPLATVDDGSCITPAANDLCADAIGLTPGTITINNEAACQNEGIAGSCHFSGDDEDASLWYTFTTPAADAEVRIYTTNPAGWTDTQLTVFDGCGGAELYCDDDDDAGSGLPSGGTLLSAIVIPCGDLTPSTTYTVQVDAFNTSSGDVDLVLEIDELVCTPAVLGCTDADGINFDPLADTDDGSCIIPTCDTDDGVPATPALSENYCYDTGVVSFTYEADPGEQVTIVFTAGSMESCCDDLNIYDGQTNADPVLVSTTGDISAVTATSTSGFITVEFDGDVSIDCASGAHAEAFWDVYCGSSFVPPVPGCTDPAFCEYDPAATVDDGSCLTPVVANDLCANAIPVAVGGSVVVDNSCALADGPAISCSFESVVQNDVWYSFVAPAPGGTLVIETTFDGTGTLDDTQIQVLDACGGSIIACDDDGGNDLFMSLVEISTCDLVEGNTYLIQVDGYNGTAGTCNLDITTGDLDGCTNPIALNYDECATIDDGSCVLGVASAIAINAELFPNCTGQLGTTVLPGETSLPENGPFSGNPDDEAWYEFTVACDGAVKVLIEDIDLDMVIELYDDQLNFLAAGDDNVPAGEAAFYDGVTAGQTLLARAYAYGTGATSQFNICISTYCASSVDDPFATATFDLCGTTKCDFIAGADNYDWDLQATGGGANNSYSTVGNNTYVDVSDFAPGVVYGETYDVTINTNFTDPDLGPLTVAGQTVDQMVMEAAPFVQLNNANIGAVKQLDDYLACSTVCAADELIWEITSDGGATYLGPVTVPGNSYVAAVAAFNGIAPGTNYEARIAIVLDGVTYPFGPLQPFSTATAPLREVRSDAWCSNGPISYSTFLVLNGGAPGAVDFTWEFTNTDGVQPTFYWKKGDGIRVLRAGDVEFGGSELLLEGATYDVRVKPEYGTFLSGDNSDPSTEPTYSVVTSYGAAQQVCIVGAATVDGGGVELRSATTSIEAAIYPNPSNGDFINLNIANISEEEEKVMVDIYDLFGKLVQSEQIATTGSSNLNEVISLNSELASGLYMVNITVGDAIQTERLVIEK